MDKRESSNSSDTQKRQLAPRWYAIILVGLIVAFFGATALGNYFLNPLVYNTGYMREAALAMMEGKNIAVHDPNINWRALRREQIELLSDTPDVVVSGGSRWQEARTELVPDYTLFNAHGHSDYFEDFLAVSELLYANNHLPETLVLSLRYVIFEPIENRAHTGWREWMPEYRQMAERLGASTPSRWTTMRTEHWLALFSPRELVERIRLIASTDEEVGVTEDLTKETLDVIASDGSLRWSQRNAELFTPQYAREDGLSRLERNFDRDLVIDLEMVDATEKLIQFLQSNGVKVVFAQTPFQPDFYQGIKDQPFGQVLQEVEEIAKRFEEEYGVLAIGSFDASRVSCSAEEFIDWHHATPSCLGRILTQIPWLSSNQEAQQ